MKITGGTPSPDKNTVQSSPLRDVSPKGSGLAPAAPPKLSAASLRGEAFSRALKSLLRRWGASSEEKSLPKLLSLIRSLPRGEDGVPRSTKDSRDAIRLLKALLKKSGVTEGDALKNAEAMEKQIGAERDQLISFWEAERAAGRPPVKLKEEGTHDPEESEDTALVLEMELSRLGPVKVVLQSTGLNIEKNGTAGKPAYACRIDCIEKKAARLVKKNIAPLAEKMEQRIEGPLTITVKQKNWEKAGHHPQDQGGVDLWG